MRILVVGVFNENSTNNGIANGFENAEHEVTRYNYRKRVEEISPIHRDDEIIDVSKGHDLVFFCKCNGVNIRVLDNCDGKTFYWYMDPLNGNYDIGVRADMATADYVGVAKWEVYLEAKKLNLNTHFLIEGFDPRWDYPIECEKMYEVSFIGNPYGDRDKWFNELDPVNINPLSNKYNIKHSEAVGQTEINLNFTGGGGPSDRVYKILAAGGFLLSEDYPHIEKYGLMSGKDLVLFDTREEMVEKCNYYLSHKEERDRIANHGYQTVQKFSRDNLAKQIIDIAK